MKREPLQEALEVSGPLSQKAVVLVADYIMTENQPSNPKFAPVIESFAELAARTNMAQTHKKGMQVMVAIFDKAYCRIPKTRRHDDGLGFKAKEFFFERNRGLKMVMTTEWGRQVFAPGVRWRDVLPQLFQLVNESPIGHDLFLYGLVPAIVDYLVHFIDTQISNAFDSGHAITEVIRKHTQS